MKAFLINTLLYLPAQLLGPLVQFIVLAAWTHLLDPAAFGIVTYVIAVQEFTAVAGLAWWTMFIMRFRHRYAGADEPALIAMDNRMMLLGVVSQCLMTPCVLFLLGVEPTLDNVLAVGGYLVGRLLAAHLSEWARSLHRIGIYSFAQLSGPIFGALLSLAALHFIAATASVALMAMAFGQIVGVVALLWILRRNPFHGAFSRTLFQEAAQFGVPLIASAFLYWVSINGIRQIVQMGDGAAGTGLLSAGWSLGLRIASVIAMLCTAAAYPLAVERVESGDRFGALEHIAFNGVFMLGLLAPAAAGLAMLTRPLVELIIAAPYQAETIVILPLAMLTGVVRSLKTHVGDQTLLLVEQTGQQMKLNLLDAVATIIGVSVGLHYGGVSGAVIGCLAGALFGAAMTFFYVCVIIHLPVRGYDIARILLATTAMALVLNLAPIRSNIISLGIAIAQGGVVYALCLSLLFPVVRQQARRFFQKSILSE